MERQKRAQRFVKPPPKWHQSFENTKCLMLRFSKSNWYVFYIEWLILSNHFRCWSKMECIRYVFALTTYHCVKLYSNFVCFLFVQSFVPIYFFSAFLFLSHSFRLKSRGAVMVMVIRFCIANVKYRRARTVHENNHKSCAIDVEKMKSAENLYIVIMAISWVTVLIAHTHVLFKSLLLRFDAKYFWYLCVCVCVCVFQSIHFRYSLTVFASSFFTKHVNH